MPSSFETLMYGCRDTLFCSSDFRTKFIIITLNREPTGARTRRLTSSGRGFSNRGEIRMSRCLLSGKAFLVVVPQQFGNKVDRLLRHEMLILRRDEFLPGLFRVTAEDTIKVGVKLKIVRVKVVEQLFGTQDLGNLHQLVVVVMSMEEGLLAEDHPCKHTPQTPHIKSVVILLKIDKELGSLEVTRCDADIVLPSGVVEFRQTPIDETQLPLLMIDHNIMWLNIAVHDAVGMTIV
mmetsp:Transcript_35961/g.78765  ORF Transcript_35961/g.78765 Transcript_35961/m.78765 type:complete len:235 (-) Transcript_35961:546-1250(-)